MLYYFGQNLAGFVSVLPVISAVEMLVPSDGSLVFAILAALWALAAASLTVLTYRSWTGAARDRK